MPYWGYCRKIQVSYCVPGALSPPTTRLTISLAPAWKTRGKKACSTRYVESILMIKSYLLFLFTGRQFTEVPQTVSRPWNKVLWGRYSNRTLNISPFSSVPCPLYAPHASVPTGLYIHPLFALRDRDLGSIWSNFTYYIHGVFVFLEENWKRMVQDIEKGEINPDLEITEPVPR